MILLRQYVKASLVEKEIRGQKKNKRTLYHAGQRPAAPKPKARWFDREQADEEWTRHWLDSPVKSGVFLTPNPVDIAQFHGVSGNVYAYKVPEWVIEKSGGIHRYDKGSEILIPEDVWEEAGNEIEFLGKSMSQQGLWDKIDWSLHMSRGRQGNPQKPGWMSTEEWKQDRATDARGNHLIGLRATKHLENAVKMMTPAERAEALEAFEQDKLRGGSNWPDWVQSTTGDWDRPRTEKDLEIIALLKKHMNESALREYIGALLTEDPLGFVHDLAADSDKFGGEDKLFFGGDVGRAGGKAIKRAFAKNADHQFLSTIDTVHWGDVYGLEDLVGRGKDELSTTMIAPGQPLVADSISHNHGLLVKGRITLATNDQDELFSGTWANYTGETADYTEEEQAQREKSSGINKLPTVSKDYSRYGRLKRGTEFGEHQARNIPYVIDQSTWEPRDWAANEALVDNWKPVAIVVSGEDTEYIEDVIRWMDEGDSFEEASVGNTKQVFRIAEKFGVPIIDENRNELWRPE